MRPGPACLLAALLAAPSNASAGAPSWGIDGTTVVRGGAALPDHIIVLVSAWCTFVDDPSVWHEAHEFHGEPEDPPTVSDNYYGCSYRLVEDGEPLAGAPWDAPRARDDVLYAVPRAKFPTAQDTIAAFDNIPLTEFYPRMESGKDGILRANLGPSRGIPVPDDSPLVGFQDTLRAELRDGAFTLTAEQRTWKLRDGREVAERIESVEPLGDDLPADSPPLPDPADEAPVPEAAPEPTPTPVPKDIPAAAAPEPVREHTPSASPAPVREHTPSAAPAPVREHTPSAAPEPVLEDTLPAATTAAPSAPSTPLTRDLAIGGGSLALGLFAGFALRRRR